MAIGGLVMATMGSLSFSVSLLTNIFVASAPAGVTGPPAGRSCEGLSRPGCLVRHLDTLPNLHAPTPARRARLRRLAPADTDQRTRAVVQPRGPKHHAAKEVTCIWNLNC